MVALDRIAQALLAVGAAGGYGLSARCLCLFDALFRYPERMLGKCRAHAGARAAAPALVLDALHFNEPQAGYRFQNVAGFLVYTTMPSDMARVMPGNGQGHLLGELDGAVGNQLLKHLRDMQHFVVDSRHAGHFREVILQRMVAARAVGDDLFHARLLEGLDIALHEIEKRGAVADADRGAAAADLLVAEDADLDARLLEDLYGIDDLMLQQGIESRGAAGKKQILALSLVKIGQVKAAWSSRAAWCGAAARGYRSS